MLSILEGNIMYQKSSALYLSVDTQLEGRGFSPNESPLCCCSFFFLFFSRDTWSYLWWRLEVLH